MGEKGEVRIKTEAMLRQFGKRNISKTANELLAKELFKRRKSMFGVLKGRVSVKDIREGKEHEDLYS